jgi:hypothetical protein
MNLCAKVVRVEIAKQVFWENGGETNGHETMSIGKKPIIAQRFIFTTSMDHFVKKNCNFESLYKFETVQ